MASADLPGPIFPAPAHQSVIKSSSLVNDEKIA